MKGSGTAVTFRELAFAKNVTESDIKTDNKPETGDSGFAVPVCITAAASGAVLWSCRRYKLKKIRVKAKD